MLKSYKLKTKKAIQKRFSLTGSNKVRSMSSGIRHRLVSKPTNRNRNQFGLQVLHPSNIKRLKKYIYLFASK